MNLEQLQALSDDELNELAAAKVMGWEKQGKVYRDGHDIIFIDAWNPTGDMNDATWLSEILKVEYMTCLYIDRNDGATVHVTTYGGFRKQVEVTDEFPSRAITIASILAKE